jgi:uncharacterized protein YgbK (DUF1537 family)
MSPPLAILIADDLTGSLDSVSPFAALGAMCLVAVSADTIGEAMGIAPEVLAINLGTRELPPDVARERAASATRAVLSVAGPGTLWIKKIDSRLKGPIAAEVAGMAQVLHPERILLCPAIPELGRVVSRALLQGHGIAEAIPVAEKVALDLPCTFPDATTDADLDRLAASVTPGTLIAVARGFTSAIARRLCPGRKPAASGMPKGPVGFAIGSRDPVTLAQIDQLCTEATLRIVPAPDGKVDTPAVAGSFLMQATKGTGASGQEVAARLATGLIRHTSGISTLVLSGGETAAAVLDAIGAGLLRVEGEVLPGLPLSRAIGLPDFPAVITKSGGFGQPDTLLRLWQFAQDNKGST